MVRSLCGVFGLVFGNRRKNGRAANLSFTSFLALGNPAIDGGERVSARVCFFESIGRGLTAGTSKGRSTQHMSLLLFC